MLGAQVNRKLESRTSIEAALEKEQKKLCCFNMKASVFFVFAVVCWFAAQAEESPKMLILKKVMNELDRISNGMNINIALKSPTIYDLEDCCVKSALNCFRSKVLYLSVPNGRLKTSQKIIYKELHRIMNRLSNCKPKELEKAQCKPCDSFEEVDSQIFVRNLKTLLLKIYSTE